MGSGDRRIVGWEHSVRKVFGSRKVLVDVGVQRLTRDFLDYEAQEYGVGVGVVELGVRWEERCMAEANL